MQLMTTVAYGFLCRFNTVFLHSDMGPCTREIPVPGVTWYPVRLSGNKFRNSQHQLACTTVINFTVGAGRSSHNSYVGFAPKTWVPL
eukprot:2292030-Rhodomonas_salina.1